MSQLIVCKTKSIYYKVCIHMICEGCNMLCILLYTNASIYIYIYIYIYLFSKFAMNMYTNKCIYMYIIIQVPLAGADGGAWVHCYGWGWCCWGCMMVGVRWGSCREHVHTSGSSWYEIGCDKSLVVNCWCEEKRVSSIVVDRLLESAIL